MIFARKKGHSEGRSLLLSAHIDVVPIEADSGWESDPWSGHQVKRRVYGRGAWDDKSGVVIMLAVLRALQELGIELDGDLVVASVPDEEVGGRGTSALLASGERADAAVYLDGVRESIVNGMMGQAWFRVIIKGVPGGAVGPDRVINPIPLAARLVTGFAKLEDELNAQAARSYGGVARPIRIQIGAVEAGAWPNSIPARCVLQGQINFLPERTLSWAREQIRNVVQSVAAQDEWFQNHPPALEFTGVQSEACSDTASPELLAALSRAFFETYHRDPTVRQILGFVDTPIYSEYNIPSLCYGPTGGNPHGANEYVEIDSLIASAQVVARFVLQWCGARQS